MIDSSKFSIIKKIYCSYINDRLAKYDVSYMYCPYIIELYRKNGQTMAELSRQLVMDKSNTSRIINSLQSKGFIDIVEGIDDKRVKQIYLNLRGEELANYILEQKAEWNRVLFNGISSEEWELMNSLLDRVMYNAQKTIEKDNRDA